MFFWVDRLYGCVVGGWLVGWWVARLVGWLVGWLAGWLVGWLARRLVVWGEGVDSGGRGIIKKTK